MDELNHAVSLLKREQTQYKNNYFMMWVLTIIGVLIGACLTPLALDIWELLGWALFDRSGLDSLSLDKLGNNSWNDILQQDLIITSYEYNSKQPRFYSKYFNNLNPGLYD